MNKILPAKLLLGVLGVALMLVASTRVQAQAPGVAIGDLQHVDRGGQGITLYDPHSGELSMFFVDSETFITLAGVGPVSSTELAELWEKYDFHYHTVVIYDPATSIAEEIHIAHH